MENKIKRLIEHRDAILLAEIGALIHDLGKLSEEFISNKSPGNPLSIDKDGHAKWIFEWHSNLKNLLNINIKILNKQILIKNIVKKHHKGNGDLLNLFKICADRLDSGIDKGAVSDKNKQPFDQTYISTPFGYEFKRIEIEKEELKKKREEFVKVLEEVLNELNNLLSNGKVPEEKWIELRKKLYNKAKECFSYGLGETRRSANDVTLWDHSHSTASLFKSALAEIILSGKWEIPSKIQWKLLLIRFNGLDYIFKGVKVSDIEGRQIALKNALDKVRDLLEVIVPVGNEIYRDENGSVFLVPESLEKELLGEKVFLNLENKDAWLLSGMGKNVSLVELIHKIFEIETKGELKPEIIISEKKSRGAVILGYCLEKYKVLYNKPFGVRIKEAWKNAKDKVVCSICGLKPADPKEKVCKDCKELRTSRAKEWYKKRKKNSDSTIWLDEIRDKNNRVGIIVGAFDLRYWLNGMWFNTCFTKTLQCLKKQSPEIFHSINSWEDLVLAVEEALKLNNPDSYLTKFKKSDGSNVKIGELLEALGGKDSYKGQSAIEYFEAIVVNREGEILKDLYGIDISKASLREKAELLVLFLMRKNPSFARIRRVWETCAKFWEKVREDVLKQLKEEKEERIRYKIILTEDSRKIIKNLIDQNKISKYSAYEIRSDNFSLPVVIADDNNILIVDYIESEEVKNKIEESLKEGFELYKPSDYGYYSRKIYPYESNQQSLRCKQLVEDSKYKPYFTIVEGYPSIFAFIIPLKYAWKVIKSIKKLYEIEFSKVQNRLPLKLGLFAMKRKYPLYSDLDCVKRFLFENIEMCIWKVEESCRASSDEVCKIFDGKLGNYVQKLVLKNKTKKITTYISYSLGDPSKEDIFYPNFVINDHNIMLYSDFCKNVFGSPNNRVSFKHVKDLSKNDEVIFIPSIFDFELLDSNIRRFDIGKKRRHWLFKESENNPKPYLLWDIDNFDRLLDIVKKYSLSNTQIMNLFELLLSKIDEWNLYDVEKLKSNKEFEKFVENSILDVPLRLKGRINKEDFEFIRESILNGLFFDFVDLWHTILKLDFKESDI